MFPSSPWPAWTTRIFVGLLGLTIVMTSVAAKPALAIGGAILGLYSTGLLLYARRLPDVSRLGLVVCGGTLALMATSLFWAINPSEIYEDAPIWVVVFTLGLGMIAAARHYQLTHRQILFLLACWAAAAWWQIITQFTDFYFYELFYKADMQGVDKSLWTNKPVVALTLMTPALLYPLWVRLEDDRYRLLFGAVVSTAVLMLLASYAQSAGLAMLAVGLAALMPVQSRRFWKTVRITTMVGVLALPWMMQPAFHYLADDLKRIELTKRGSSAQRLEIWAAIADKIEERPVWGFGYNATNSITDFNIQKIYTDDTRVSHPHNLILQFWLEFGLVGALLGMAAIVALWRKIEIYRERRTRRLYFMTMSGVLMVALVGWGIWQGWWVVLLFVLITLNLMIAAVLPPKKSLIKSDL